MFLSVYFHVRWCFMLEASIAAFHQAVVATNLLAFSDPPRLVEYSGVVHRPMQSRPIITKDGLPSSFRFFVGGLVYIHMLSTWAIVLDNYSPMRRRGATSRTSNYAPASFTPFANWRKTASGSHTFYTTAIWGNLGLKHVETMALTTQNYQNSLGGYLWLFTCDSHPSSRDDGTHRKTRWFLWGKCDRKTFYLGRGLLQEKNPPWKRK